jgi:hypothetical protein
MRLILDDNDKNNHEHFNNALKIIGITLLGFATIVFGAKIVKTYN